MVDEQNGIVRLIDFENARDYSDVKSKEEIESLKGSLIEDTGRGSVENFSDRKKSFMFLINRTSLTAFDIHN